jgi:hypothetical protein
MIRFDVCVDDRFHWRPRWHYRLIQEPVPAWFFDYKWYLIVWFLWWEIVIEELI